MLLHEVTRVAANVLHAAVNAGLPTPESISVTAEAYAGGPPKIYLHFENDRVAVRTVAARLFEDAEITEDANRVAAETEWASGIKVAAIAISDHARVWADQQVVDRAAIAPAKAVA